MKTHVDADDARPAGKPDECFYCNRKIGEEHTFECVIPSKRVRLRVTLEYETDVPRSWDKDTIERIKEDQGCLSNIVGEIKEYSDRLDVAHPNTCQVEHPPVEYLGEVNG